MTDKRDDIEAEVEKIRCQDNNVGVLDRQGHVLLTYIDQLKAERDAALKDCWVLKGALGYPVPCKEASDTDTLSDGTKPTCGLCGGRQRQIDAALARAEKLENALRQIECGCSFPEDETQKAIVKVAREALADTKAKP